MSQQTSLSNARKRYKRKLFVDSGIGFEEVTGRIIEPYSPPIPTLKVKELEIIGGPSHFHHMGSSSYKLTLNILFKDKLYYSRYMATVGGVHKFYDEKGSIFEGFVESIRSTTAEANRKYKVEISLTVIKKQRNTFVDKYMFQDIKETDWMYGPISRMIERGIVHTNGTNGDPFLYFDPNNLIGRAEFISYVMRTKRLIEKMVRG